MARAHDSHIFCSLNNCVNNYIMATLENARMSSASFYKPRREGHSFVRHQTSNIKRIPKKVLRVKAPI